MPEGSWGSGLFSPVGNRAWGLCRQNPNRIMGSSMVQTILVPVDGSEGSAAAMDLAVELARPLEATIHVLHVADTDRIDSLPGIDMYELNLLEAGNELVADAANVAEEHDIPVVQDTVPGTPHREILDYAEANHIDLIVIGTAGKSRVERWLLGSVTERVVRKAEIPVLTVRTATTEGTTSE